jgi:hypothetical protein
VFLTSIVNDLAVATSSSGSSTSTSTTYPAGGVETGDGSTPIDP